MSHLVLSREQVRRLDRCAIEDFGIPGLVLMENAGGGAARILLREYGSAGAKIGGGRTGDQPSIGRRAAATRRFAVVCGSGNNGGDGFVIARHLFNAGAPVTVLLAAEAAKLSGDARTNYEIVRQMAIPMVEYLQESQRRQHGGVLRDAEVIVDALLGTGFSGQVRSPLREVIEEINALTGKAIVAIDVPSGLDCDSGVPGGVAVRAERTITFVATKAGFNNPEAETYVGKVDVVDIGAPVQLILQRLEGR